MEKIILLTSKDEFLIKDKINSILKELKANSDMLELYDLDEGSILELTSELTTESFFDDFRIFYIKNPEFFSNDNYKNDQLNILIKYFEMPSESNYLIISSTDYNSNNKLKDYLKNVKRINLDSNSMSLPEYLDNYVKTNRLSINTDAKNALLSRVEDFNSLENEIKKLECYSDGKIITIDMVELLVSKNLDNKAYEIASYLYKNERGEAYKIVMDLLEMGVMPSQILRAITNQITETLYVKKMVLRKNTKEEIAAYMNYKKPGRAYYAMIDAKSVKLSDLENYISSLEQINVDSRSGQVDEKEALELFILKG